MKNIDKEFDAMLERMQTAKSKKAMKAAFGASELKLARSAVEAAMGIAATRTLPSASSRSRGRRAAASSKARSS